MKFFKKITDKDGSTDLQLFCYLNELAKQTTSKDKTERDVTVKDLRDLNSQYPSLKAH